jgi:AcrR family transcriptional regulator
VSIERGNTFSAKAEELTPLPRGRHLLPPEEVERHQRERILRAVAQGMAERGYATLTVASIIAEAHVSRTTFYAQFANKKEAVVGTYEVAFRRLLVLLEEACAAEEEWPTRLRRGLEATVGFAAAQPAMALLLAAQGEVADREVGETMLAARQRLVELLRRGRSHPGAELLPEVTEEALVGAIAAVISRAVLDGHLENLDALRTQLVEFVLVFY